MFFSRLFSVHLQSLYHISTLFPSDVGEKTAALWYNDGEDTGRYGMSVIIPKNWKNCMTCNKWCGQRQPNDPWAHFIKCEDAQTKGKCLGGGFNGADMTALSTCSKWEPQYK